MMTMAEAFSKAHLDPGVIEKAGTLATCYSVLKHPVVSAGAAMLGVSQTNPLVLAAKHPELVNKGIDLAVQGATAAGRTVNRAIDKVLPDANRKEKQFVVDGMIDDVPSELVCSL